MRGNWNRRSFLAAAAAGAAAPALARAKGLAPAYPIPDEPVTADDFRALRAMASEVFAKNRVTVAEGTFHMPSCDKYRSMFAWDSGWHAIGMTRIDPGIAASEIELLLKQQVEETGRVSHEVKFPQLEAPPDLLSKIGGKLGASQWDAQGRTAMIDPPSFMVAAEKIFALTQDRNWLSRVLPRLERCAHYLTHDRDLFGDGLVAVVHPWETGTDSSPAYDQILHLHFNTPLGAPRRGLLYPHLLKSNAEVNWDPQELKKRNRFVLEDLTFNSITIRGLLSISALNEAVGEAEKALKFREQARAMTDALDRINWVEAEGCYFSRYDVKSPKLARRTTCASLLPLFTGLVSKERAERLVREHLLNPAEFRQPYLVPFNAKDELDHERVYMEDLLLWRGHCIWTNMNWMMNEGLLSYGYREEARELTRRTAKMIRHEGLREFYDFRNGQGKGATNFNWPAVVLDMIARSWPEAMTG
jgi:glycogen debranching enzyme